MNYFTGFQCLSTILNDRINIHSYFEFRFSTIRTVVSKTEFPLALGFENCISFDFETRISCFVFQNLIIKTLNYINTLARIHENT